MSSLSQGPQCHCQQGWTGQHCDQPVTGGLTRVDVVTLAAGANPCEGSKWAALIVASKCLHSLLKMFFVTFIKSFFNTDSFPRLLLLIPGVWRVCAWCWMQKRTAATARRDITVHCVTFRRSPRSHAGVWSVCMASVRRQRMEKGASVSRGTLERAVI